MSGAARSLLHWGTLPLAMAVLAWTVARPRGKDVPLSRGRQAAIALLVLVGVANLFLAFTE